MTNRLTILAATLFLATSQPPSASAHLPPDTYPAISRSTLLEDSMSNDKKQLKVEHVLALLDEVATLGLNHPDVDAFVHGMALVIKCKLDQGVLDERRYWLLHKYVADVKRNTDECLLAFKLPDPVKIFTPGGISFLYSPYSNNIRASYALPVYERGFQYFCDTGGGKSSVLRNLASAWTTQNPCLPCIIFAAKPDQFFFKLAREPHNQDRCLLLKCSKDTFYNAFASISRRAIDFLRVRLQYWQVCMNRWDSGSVVAHIMKLFDKEKHITGLVAPTIDYVIDKLENITLPKSLFNPTLKASAYEAFSLMQANHLGRNVMNCQVGIDWKEVWEKGLVVVIETNQLSEADTHFLISCILSDLREINDATPSLSDMLVIIDEGGNLVNQRWDSGNRASPLATEITLLRGSGICLAIAYHTVSGISAPVRSNSAITLVGPLGNGDDILSAALSQALTPEQRAHVPHLLPYTAIMRVSGVEYTEPYIVTWDPPDVYLDFSEAERQDINRKVMATLSPIIPVNYRTIVRTSSAPASPTPASTPVAIGDHRTVLRHIADHPFLNVSDHAAGITLSAGKKPTSKQLKIVLNELENLGFCGFLTIQIKSRWGRGGDFYYLTANGHAAIGSVHTPARGDYGHDYAQRYIQDLLSQKRITSVIEDILPGTSKRVDLGLTCPHTKYRVAIEIPISTFASEKSQTDADLACGWQRVIEVCLNTTDLATLKAAFKSAGGMPDPRVTACVPADIRNAPNLSEIFDNPNFWATT
ncbi:MAG: hypothetical protein PHR77_03290 [Kiritimatiellae bacterium]|nr:hypothetical protein [Kiritimatiellia bacterium]MDD5519582.1 hypothetical protein [Kiritimatiellia bacterium]